MLLSIGYLAGRYREGAEIAKAGVSALLIGAFTLVADGGSGALELMLGVESAVSLLVVREIIVQALLAVVLGLAVYPLVRRVLGSGAGRLRARRRAAVRAPQASPPRQAGRDAARTVRVRRPTGATAGSGGIA